ncbi:MAG: glycine dehydrogenase, partial [Bauldia sp.]
TASRLADRLGAIPGVKLVNETFFNEFTLKLPKPAAPVVEALAKKRVLGGVPVSRLYPDDPKLADLLLVAATETVSDEDIAAYEAALKEVLK